MEITTVSRSRCGGRKLIQIMRLALETPNLGLQPCARLMYLYAVSASPADVGEEQVGPRAAGAGRGRRGDVDLTLGGECHRCSLPGGRPPRLDLLEIVGESRRSGRALWERIS